MEDNKGNGKRLNAWASAENFQEYTNALGLDQKEKCLMILQKEIEVTRKKIEHAKAMGKGGQTKVRILRSTLAELLERESRWNEAVLIPNSDGSFWIGYKPPENLVPLKDKQEPKENNASTQ